jgi:hypothetical protein
MSQDNTSDSPLPHAIQQIFGPRPILLSEDMACYDELMRRVVAEVKPHKMHQWLLVKDVVDS